MYRSPSSSLDKLDFTGVKILLLIFLKKKNLNKNYFVKEELLCSNVNKIKNPKRWDI